MKYLAFLTLLPTLAMAGLQLEAGYGAAQVAGEPITTLHLQGGYFKDDFMKIGPGSFGWGAGVRVTQFQADLYQPESREELLEDVNFMSQNIFGQVHYTLNNWKLGFNLDILGSSSGNSATVEGTDNKLDVVAANSFRGGESDTGTLNSHLFASYHIDSFSFKAGLAHIVVEFEDDGLTGDDRRQRFFDTFFLSLGYSL